MKIYEKVCLRKLNFSQYFICAKKPRPPTQAKYSFAILLKIYLSNNTPPHPNKCLNKTWSQTPLKTHGVVFSSNTTENERSWPLPRLLWCYLQHPSVERWDSKFGFETFFVRFQFHTRPLVSFFSFNHHSNHLWLYWGHIFTKFIYWL